VELLAFGQESVVEKQKAPEQLAEEWELELEVLVCYRRRKEQM